MNRGIIEVTDLGSPLLYTLSGVKVAYSTCLSYIYHFVFGNFTFVIYPFIKLKEGIIPMCPTTQLDFFVPPGRVEKEERKI